MTLELLHIENIAVIEKADIEFSPGLNVLTGETGAGKSIVIDALNAVTGGRVSRDIVRTGADGALVTAVFSGEPDKTWIYENGIEPDEDGKTYIMRRVTADGKSTCRVNGCPVPALQLRELGGTLLDIHGQNDGRKLLDEAAHLAYLDSYGGLAEKLSSYKAAYKALREKREQIERLTMDEGDKERRLDTLRSQVDEIERAKIKPGESDLLSARRDMLQNASKLTEAVEYAFEAMYGGERADGAVALIGQAQAQLSRAERYSESLRALGARLAELQYSAQDIAEELRDIKAELDFSPEELDALESRLDMLRRINRKYGDETAALEFLERAKAELSDIEDSSDRLVKLERELLNCLSEAENRADTLSSARRTAAETLETRIMAELADLNMPGVAFKVDFEAARGSDGLNANGRDEVRFLMSANAGETPGRISRIASGGELSRIMLALKNVLGSGQDTGAMVFDEIDTGVSGVAAQRVGEKLSELAANRQVLCVTHLPQIAVMADTHFEIKKTVRDGRTFTQVNRLDFEGRKKEVARLSGGENITETTLTSAAEQLAAADEFKRAQRTAINA